MNLPPMIPVRQHLPGAPLRDVAGAVRSEVTRSGIMRGLKPGMCVGVGVGSRGTANLPAIVATVVAEVRATGAKPVIIPAMGSHGGATPAGQRAILESLGVTARSVGAPIRPSMAVERLGETAAGTPVWFSREALRCDGVIVVNRIKPHTDFRSHVESGLMKMITIGLGKQRGAATVHALRVAGLRDHLPEVAREVIRRGHIIGGVAMIENGYGETVSVTAVPAAEIETVEAGLLQRAKRLAPRLPFDDMDVLIVDWLGKDVSGTGLDPKVLGRMRMPGENPEYRRPRIHNLVVLRLTPASHGNGVGTGLAEFVPRALADAIDWNAVKANAMTGGFLERAKLPLVMDSDREAIEAAMTVGLTTPPEELRVARIQDTSHVGAMWVSPPLEPEARRKGLDILGPAQPLRFDKCGNSLDISKR